MARPARVNSDELLAALRADEVIAPNTDEVTIWVRRGEPVEVDTEGPLPRRALQPIVDFLTGPTVTVWDPPLPP